MLAAVRVLAHLLALLAGAAAGVLGSFTFAYTKASMPVGLLVALFLCLAVFVTAGMALKSRGAAAIATAGWLAIVGLLSMNGPGGDLVVPATTLGYRWLLAGIMLAGLSIALPYAPLRAAPEGRAAPADALAGESSGRAPAGR